MHFFPRRKLRTPHLAKRRRNVLIFRSALGVVFVFSVFLGLVTLSKMDSLTIVSVEAVGNSVITDKELVEIAESELSGKYFWLFPRKNAFIYPKRAIEASVLESFERVKDVRVSKGSLKAISVSISEYAPNSLYCGESQVSDEQCYFMNEEGLVYGLAPYFSGNAFFRFYGDVVGDETIGASFLNGRFEHYSFFVETLRRVSITPIYLAIIDETDFEVGFEDGSRILVAQDSDFTDVVENLRSVLESESFGSDEVVDYIDLRFGNKVYYKLK
ncbi:MAG: hypothetical protein ISR99_01870 [Parcubacteria group bacterium]|nr:hypothetical protein [Parcubacteria group bacterium]